MSELPEAHSVTLRRVFDAPIDLVFRAWTEAEHVRRWMKCDGAARLEVENWVAIPGNEFKTRMRLEGVFDTRGAGVVTEVEAPTLFAYTTYADPELGTPEMQVRIELVDLDGKTELTLTHTGIPTIDLCEIMEAGWTSSLALLAKLDLAKGGT